MAESAFSVSARAHDAALGPVSPQYRHVAAEDLTALMAIVHPAIQETVALIQALDGPDLARRQMMALEVLHTLNQAAVMIMNWSDQLSY